MTPGLAMGIGIVFAKFSKFWEIFSAFAKFELEFVVFFCVCKIWVIFSALLKYGYYFFSFQNLEKVSGL